MSPLPCKWIWTAPRFWEPRDQPHPGVFLLNDKGGRERDPGNEVGFNIIGITETRIKNKHNGIPVNNWFASYLVGRQQTTQIGVKNISNWKEVILSGVPQGSVLGPLLFLICINDISNSSNRFKFYLFADDTNLLYADKNLKLLETTVNAELCNIYDWLISYH